MEHEGGCRTAFYSRRDAEARRRGENETPFDFSQDERA